MAYTTVNGLFSAICDAIRTKLNINTPIAHQDIPQKILSISSGALNVAEGTFTPTADYTTFSIAHGLGAIPTFAVVYAENNNGINFSNTNLYIACKGFISADGTSQIDTINAWGVTRAYVDEMLALDATNIIGALPQLSAIGQVKLKAGVTYHWIARA